MKTRHYEVRVVSNQRRLRGIEGFDTLGAAKSFFDVQNSVSWGKVANSHGGITRGVELVKIPYDSDGFLDYDHEVIIKSIYYANYNGNVVKIAKEDL